MMLNKIKATNKDSILLELKSTLNGQLKFNNGESFLTLLYKLEELDDSKINKNDSLEINFYRNWCQHAYLDRKQKFICGLVNYINEKLICIRKNNDLLEGGYPEGNCYDKYYFWNEIIVDIVSCVNLKKEISHKLKKHKVKAINNKWWFSFKISLLSSLVNVPVSINLNECPIEYINIKKCVSEFSKLDRHTCINIICEVKYDDKELSELTIFEKIII